MHVPEESVDALAVRSLQLQEAKRVHNERIKSVFFMRFLHFIGSKPDILSILNTYQYIQYKLEVRNITGILGLKSAEQALKLEGVRIRRYVLERRTQSRRASSPFW